MAKITLLNGTVIEGTIEELRQMGAKFPVEEETKEDPLKVGHYAKVVNNDGAVPKLEIGTLLKIIGEYSSAYEYVTLDGEHTGFAYPYRIVKATDEEVAKAKLELLEAKAQAERQQLEAKWAKINRKPNEYKKGDIVLYKGDGPGKEQYLEVHLDTQSNGRIPVNFKGSFGVCHEYPEDIELITPVEARFDSVQ